MIRVALDDELGANDLVPGNHEETPGIRADALIFGRCQPDRLGAVRTSAFAAKRHPLVTVTRPQPPFNPLVGLAKQGLVSADTRGRDVVHAVQTTPATRRPRTSPAETSECRRLGLSAAGCREAGWREDLVLEGVRVQGLAEQKALDLVDVTGSEPVQFA